MIALRPPSAAVDTFEQLYDAHARDVLQYAAFLVRDPDDAADVAGEAFERAFDAWRAGRGPVADPLPWLFLITRRIAIDRARRARLLRWLPLPRTEAPAPDSLAAREFWLWLDRLAEALPARQREVLYLRYRRDLSDAQVGEVLGLSPSGVRTLASRAIQRLREHPELLA